ncbi:MAG: endonuclease/exonuclease/phosphatase, partial [Deinococcus sp.]|nr:endonuclease/exonuclease/phosphatase [Deinococcus sp.]
MRLTIALTVSCALLLAACGSTPPTSDTARMTEQAQAQKVAVLSVQTAPEVKFVSLELKESKSGTVQTATAVPQDGKAIFQINNVAGGTFQGTVRAYDQDDRAVMLYRGAGSISLKIGRVTTFPPLTRVTATVTVNAAPTSALSATFSAKLGETTLPMTLKQGVASVQFPGVPTARALKVLVQGTSSDGQATQSGEATFNLSEGGVAVPVTLTEIASCPVPIGPLTTIPAIQGTGTTSPLAGQTVTVRGVVTSDLQSGLGGFTLQDAKGDGNADTSDGVFVFTGLGTAAAPQPVTVGDLVQLTGTVKEFFSFTQIDTVSDFAKCSGGLIVKPIEVKAPFNDLEKYEGMSVTFPEKLTVTDNFTYGRFGELGLSAGGRLFNPTNGNVTPVPTATELAARRIILD